MTTTSGAVGPDRFRGALGRFATGVTVITTATADGPIGCTVSAFCSLSLDPPLVLACLGRERSMHRALAAAPGFGVSILASDQGAVATAPTCGARSPTWTAPCTTSETAAFT